MNEKLIQGCKKLGLTLSEEQFKQLEIYIKAVLDFNKSYNLMKADNEDELAVNHVLDSLAAVPHIAGLIDSSSKIGDIGSGGGCPGIPLAVAFPENSFTLVERMEKRCTFLESAIHKMNLKNVKVLCSPADAVEKEIFDLEVFRAFHPFDKKIVKLLFAMLKKGGHLAAYKARLEKIKTEMSEVEVMVPDYKVITLSVPYLEDHERNLVVIKK
ncbi:16S rRNA (guanine(527)-N(7))-methyltransferase RsmG [Treponema sp.]|uniref:16S rRNA (guanine(527)-N(7))-methyltransferase RsmG n=1 Tax=Treponema sp. TaxID=166 RepID=UPI0025D27468|nr:16S rRNA (guanine(527)-N(7))-methyltransferase RsmG [Treponema sp.]MCR5218025.1 16S rRNA (guanine(527)-N(7))-methyltransferase RsmG [Treponema sp.]